MWNFARWVILDSQEIPRMCFCCARYGSDQIPLGQTGSTGPSIAILFQRTLTVKFACLRLNRPPGHWVLLDDFLSLYDLLNILIFPNGRFLLASKTSSFCPVVPKNASKKSTPPRGSTAQIHVSPPRWSPPHPSEPGPPRSPEMVGFVPFFTIARQTETKQKTNKNHRNQSEVKDEWKIIVLVIS